ncbi:hypothetical protein K502DRAFT_60620 [Neoconidiobolus thromboides FSU 785]|nr:hypothetical protein K502DRAFT_60620 [Neoconidiobolus thromboides FSU 785]
MFKLFSVPKIITLKSEPSYFLNITTAFFMTFKAFLILENFLSNSLLYRKTELTFKKLTKGFYL